MMVRLLCWCACHDGALAMMVRLRWWCACYDGVLFMMPTICTPSRSACAGRSASYPTPINPHPHPHSHLSPATRHLSLITRHPSPSPVAPHLACAGRSASYPRPTPATRRSSRCCCCLSRPSHSSSAGSHHPLWRQQGTCLGRQRRPCPRRRRVQPSPQQRLCPQ